MPLFECVPTPYHLLFIARFQPSFASLEESRLPFQLYGTGRLLLLFISLCEFRLNLGLDRIFSSVSARESSPSASHASHAERTTAKMSFGFGVGDFLAVLQLANDVRKKILDAPEDL